MGGKGGAIVAGREEPPSPPSKRKDNRGRLGGEGDDFGGQLWAHPLPALRAADALMHLPSVQQDRTTPSSPGAFAPERGLGPCRLWLVGVFKGVACQPCRVPLFGLAERPWLLQARAAHGGFRS